MRNDSTPRLLRQLNQFRQLGPLAPRLRVGLRLHTGRPGSSFFRLPLQRSLLMILISGAFLVVFCIPYFTVGGLARSSGDSLFDVVATLFSLFWLLGWSVGVLFLLALFLVSAFGTETLQLRPGWLTLRFEVLRLGIGADFRADRIGRLHWQLATGAGGNQQRSGEAGAAAAVEQHPPDGAEPGTAHSWRGDHLVFDYAGQPVRVGSGLTESQARQIIRQVQTLVIEASPDFPEPVAEFEPAARVDAQRAAAPLASPLPDVAPDGGLQATSTRVLLLANLIPLIGVLLADWRIGDIMLLFWAESAIIGLFNLLKMWVIGRWSVLLLGPFFLGHFGGFMAGHLLFIYALFLSGPDGLDPSAGEVAADFVQLWPALLGLLVSHGVSFRSNFLARREYLGTSLREQMHAPYRRIVIMHLTIIFGGFLTMAFAAPVLALVLLIALKTLVDARAHIGEHRRLARRSRHGSAAVD